jgi:hypothetical protein
MNKTKEKILLVVYFLSVAFAGAFFHFSYLGSTVLFFLLPSLYITIRRAKLFKQLFVYALLIGVPFVLIIDTIGRYNNAWWETSLFSYRVFGLVPLDTVLWGILYAYAIPAIYEYFFGERQDITLTRKFWKFDITLLGFLGIFLIAFSFNREWFAIPYFYALFAGIFYFLTSFIGLIRNPRMFLHLWKQCLYFSILLFIEELGALAAHQWGFSGSQYLGIIHIGNLLMPFEEMIWILIGVPAFLYVYLELTNPSEK